MSNTQIQMANVTTVFDPEAYTIVIKRTIIDGESVFHGRVTELPDLEAFERTHQEAYEFLVEGIRSAKETFNAQGRQFPSPLPDETPEYSGRVTIRMPAWLHAQLDYCAKADQTSLNQYMVTLLSWASVAAPSYVVGQNQVLGSHVGTTTQFWNSNIGGAGTISGIARERVAVVGLGGTATVVGLGGTATGETDLLNWQIASGDPMHTTSPAMNVYFSDPTSHEHFRTHHRAQTPQRARGITRLGRRATR